MLDVQLPIPAYFSQEVESFEKQSLFSALPLYLGHRLMVPQIGDFHVMDHHHNGAKVLVHHQDGVSLLSNICRHRQALMLAGRGNTKNIVCPLHRWAYNLQGDLISAPRFEEKLCLPLQKNELQSWRGLLFEKNNCNVANNMSSLREELHLDFSHYQFHSTHTLHYPFNWKTFIEVYLEDYHVVPFHQGLGQFVDCNSLEWQLTEHFSIQSVGFKSKQNKKFISPVFEHWYEAIQKIEASPPDLGAIWLLMYPNLMVEWYPYTLVVSYILPKTISACMNIVEFYYPQTVLRDYPDYPKIQQSAYMETALEDQEICERMQKGRLALYEMEKNEFGPYQQPMEKGLFEFHRWIREKMQGHFHDSLN